MSNAIAGPYKIFKAARGLFTNMARATLSLAFTSFKFAVTKANFVGLLMTMGGLIVELIKPQFKFRTLASAGIHFVQTWISIDEFRIGCYQVMPLDAYGAGRRC